MAQIFEPDAKTCFMKKTSFVSTGVVMSLFLMACNNDADINKATATSTSDSTGVAISREATATFNDTVAGSPLSIPDSTFARTAAAGNMFEVEAGNLARRSAQSERVKTFGAMMVQDHQAANRELMEAAGRSFNMPNILPEDKRQLFNELRNLRGAEFDKRYMQMMVDDHHKAISMYQKQANTGTGNGIQSYAQRTLPILEKHRDSAVAINTATK